MKKFVLFLLTLLIMCVVVTGCNQNPDKAIVVPPEPIEEIQSQEENPVEQAEKIMNQVIGKNIDEIITEDEFNQLKPLLSSDENYLFYLTHGCPHCQEFVRQLGESDKKSNVVLLLPEGMPDEYAEAFPGIERYKGQMIVPEAGSALDTMIQYVPAAFVVDKEGIILNSTIQGVDYASYEEKLINE